MEINHDKWQKTRARFVVMPFYLELGEILSKQGNRSIRQAVKFLSHIFWRWSNLESDSLSHFSPSSMLREIGFSEKWPEGGLFLAKPTMKSNSIWSKNDIEIEIDLDYIDFSGQPLISDVRRKLKNQDQQYNFGLEYNKALEYCILLCHENNWNEAQIEKHQFELVKSYILKQLESYYKQDVLAKEAFSLISWQNYWLDFLKSQRSQVEFSTDRLTNEFCNRMRQFVPEYGMTSEEFDTPAVEDKFKIITNDSFWLNFIHSLLIPLSLYLNLIDPIYVDREVFIENVTDLIRGKFKDPIPLYAACTSFFATEHGLQLISYL